MIKLEDLPHNTCDLLIFLRLGKQIYDTTEYI